MISVGFKTDKGRIRKDNEDALFVLPEQQLYIIADGVGGHKSGELASRMAVGYMAQYVSLHPVSEIKETRGLKKYFKSCFDGANSLVYGSGVGDGENSGMATTAVLCYLGKEDWAYVVNVGDSRAYLIRDSKLRQITVDHTCVQEMLESGLITSEEAQSRPDRNMITRAIGGEETVTPDFFRFKVYPEDIILLCTDGLYSDIEEQTIIDLAKNNSTMHKYAKALVAEANRCGGTDNVSAICIKIQ